MLTESLAMNRKDSPVQIALAQQAKSGNLDTVLQEAENCIRNLDWPGAMDVYRKAIAIDPRNPLPRMKLGLLCRDRGIWDEALEQFSAASEAMKNYGEAFARKALPRTRSRRRRSGRSIPIPRPANRSCAAPSS